MKTPFRYLLSALVPIALIAVYFSFNDAVSQTTAKNAVTTSTPKPRVEAIQDLKQNPPLDPSKLDAPLPRNLFIELSKLINPAVVSISTETNAKAPRRGQQQYRDPLQDFLEDFWGGRGQMDGDDYNQGQPAGPPGQGQMQGLGTGFIIRADGLILTNNHVVEGADIIKVQLDPNDKTTYDATVIGRDHRTDVALIKIDAKKPLPVAPLGSSKDVQVGEWVAAFGNPYGHAHTMTKGIISAVGRDLGRDINRFPFLQTDASINPGNSGGPLVNTQGYVIGVNTAIDARAQGIGFAIPIDDVKATIEQLEKNGHIRRGYIGVGIAPVSPQIAQSLNLEATDGAVVTTLDPKGPAVKAGFQQYDIITDFAGKKIKEPGDLQDAVADSKIGTTASVRILRVENNDKVVGKTLSVEITENTPAPKSTPESAKKYFGQKAPFNLGFKVAEMTPQMQRDFGLPPGAAQGPVVIDVERNSVAARSGLHEGDIIVSVNRANVARSTDVARQLRKGRNLVLVQRQGAALLVPLDVKL